VLGKKAIIVKQMDWIKDISQKIEKENRNLTDFKRELTLKNVAIKKSNVELQRYFYQRARDASRPTIEKLQGTDNG